jgi:hypothetical protein
MNVPGYGKMFQRDDEQLGSVPTPQEFTRVVQTLVRRYQLSHFDAIVELCEHYDREYESVKGLLTPKLKLALMEEMSGKKLLKDNSYLQHKLG